MTNRFFHSKIYQHNNYIGYERTVAVDNEKDESYSCHAGRGHDSFSDTGHSVGDRKRLQIQVSVQYKNRRYYK